ncbi:hypothetical protein DPSP01_013803 [Paraphaeosphaeria sporulosa]
MHQYTYLMPKGEGYSFFALASIAGALMLARKRPGFFTGFHWEFAISSSYIAAIYLWPTFICFRAAFDHNAKSTEWTTWKRFYVAQGGIDVLMTFFLGSLLLFKTLGGNTAIQCWNSDDDLRYKWVDMTTGAEAEPGDANAERAIYYHRDRCPTRHQWVDFYFTLRYIVSPFVYVPGMTISNMILLAIFYRPSPSYLSMEMLSLVTFFTALVLFCWGTWRIGGAPCAIRTTFAVWYPVQLCYCVAGSNLLADLQFGFLPLFFSSVFDLIDSHQRKSFDSIIYYRFRRFLWIHKDDPPHEFDGGCPLGRRDCLWCVRPLDEAATKTKIEDDEVPKGYKPLVVRFEEILFGKNMKQKQQKATSIPSKTMPEWSLIQSSIKFPIAMAMDLLDCLGAARSCIKQAFECTQLDGAQLILGRDADVNVKGRLYGKKLQTASSQGHKQIVKLLLDKGADVNAPDAFYGNALQAASSEGHEQIVKLLLGNNAKVNAPGGYYGNALQAAAEGGHEQVVKLLLDKGADVNAKGRFYGNALQAASSEGHEQTVKLLLGNNAKVNAPGGFYGNALQAAAEGGHEQVVKLLLDKGADVNAKGGFYGNALHAASSEGHEQIVTLLVGRGAIRINQD